MIGIFLSESNDRRNSLSVRTNDEPILGVGERGLAFRFVLLDVLLRHLLQLHVGLEVGRGAGALLVALGVVAAVRGVASALRAVRVVLLLLCGVRPGDARVLVHFVLEAHLDLRLAVGGAVVGAGGAGERLLHDVGRHLGEAQRRVARGGHIRGARGEEVRRVQAPDELRETAVAAGLGELAPILVELGRRRVGERDEDLDLVDGLEQDLLGLLEDAAGRRDLADGDVAGDHEAHVEDEEGGGREEEEAGLVLAAEEAGRGAAQNDGVEEELGLAVEAAETRGDVGGRDRDRTSGDRGFFGGMDLLWGTAIVVIRIIIVVVVVILIG